MGLKVGHANAIDKIVGANLRSLRIANGMSQTELAEAVNLSFQQIQKYEHGSNRIGASRIWEFCQIFHVGPSDLFANIQDEKSLVGGHQPDCRLAFLVHPKGHQMAEAFLGLKDSKNERAVIDLCKALSLSPNE